MADQDARALLLTINANIELLRSNMSAAERAVDEQTKKIQQHLDDSDKRFELFGKSLESLEAPLERLKALGEVAIGALLGESLIEAGKKGLEFAGNVKFVSEQVGTSTDFLQKYRFAAGQFGVGTAQADEGLNKFARSVGEAANGNKTLIELFNRLGVNVRDAGGNVRSVESIFLDTADAIQKVKDPAQQSADTLALMGKGAAGLKPLLADGASGFSELARQAQQLGVVLGPDLIEHSEEVNHKLAALKGIVDAQLSSAIAQNAGSIEVLATAFVKLAGGISQFLSGHPERALTILGALAGSKVGGLPGAVVGGIVGNIAGSAISAQDDEDSNDIAFRKKALRDAAQAYIVAHNTPSSEDGGYAASRGGGPSQDATQAEAAARDTYLHQRELYQRALHAPKTAEGGLGSDEAGATNDNGDDLKNAQKRLGDLEGQRAHASGAALTAINQEIVEQRRKIGFIKQGADAELASSLAAKTGAAERKGESDAKSAARKAEEARLKAIEEDRAYLGEIAQADESIARARLKLADTADARYEFEVQQLRDALTTRNGQIDDQLRAGKISPTQALTLKVKAGSAEQLGEQGAGRDRTNANETAAFNLSNDELQRQEAHLQVLDQLATTTGARRDIELRLLAIQEDAERQALQVQKDTTTDQAAKDRIQKQLDALPGQYADKQAQTIANTRSPGEQYLHDLNAGGGKDAFQTAEVGAVQSLGDGLESAAAKGLKLHGVLGSIIGDLLKIAEQQLIEKPLANALFGGGGTGGGLGGLGGIFGGIAKLFGAGGSTGALAGVAGGSGDVDSLIGGLPGLARGGSFVVGGNSGIDQNILSINGEPTIRIGSGETVAVVPPNIPSARKIGEQRQQAMQIHVNVAANDYFDAKVASISGGQVQSAAPRIASSGATLATRSAAARQRRTIPS